MEFALDGIDTKTLSESGVDVVIKKLNSNEPLKAANGEIVSIKVLGPDSGKYRSLSRTQIRKRLAKRAAGNTEFTDADMDETDHDAMEILAGCTVGWNGILDKAGKPIPCTPENALKLFENYPVVREQVDLFISERANFLQASSKA
jgi:hypothetical protein